jgi:hypothetical protein
MKPLFTATVAALIVLTAVSCRRDEAADVSASPDVVAVVGGRPVSRASFEKELARRGPEASKEVVLGDMIRFEATLAKLKAAGFDRDPEIVAAVERMLVARFEERELAAGESPAVNDVEIRERYAANATDYRIPPAVRGAVIFLKSSPKAESAARARVAHSAEDLLARAKAADSAGFERLIRENSEDQGSRYRRGDTGWLETGRAESAQTPAVAAALFALQQPGDFAPVVETPAGFYIVRLVEVRAEGTRPLAEVAEAIRHALIREKREQLQSSFVSRMRSGLDVRTNSTALEQVIAAARNDRHPPSTP